MTWRTRRRDKQVYMVNQPKIDSYFTEPRMQVERVMPREEPGLPGTPMEGTTVPSTGIPPLLESETTSYVLTSRGINPDVALSARNRRILELIKGGMTSGTDIAQFLDLSPQTAMVEL